MKLRKSTVLIQTLVVAASLAMAGCGASDDGPAPELVPETNEEHNEMLGNLGFNTELGDRTDSQGEELDQGWHPLRTRYAAFFPSQEIYLAGVNLDGTPESLRDDSKGDYDPLAMLSNPDDSWTGALYKNAVAADVDGDGLDEFVAVYFAPGSGTLKFILVDANDGKEPVLGHIDVGADATNLDGRAQPSLAAGDIEGDGDEEIAIGFGKLYLVDDLADQLVVAKKGYIDQNDVMVAMGNIDLDPQDELVVTHTETKGSLKGYYEIFDEGDIETPTQEGDLVFTDTQNVDRGYGETRVAIGDIDGNRINDIIFHGRRVSNPADSRWSVFGMRYDRFDGYYEFRSFRHDVHTSGQVPWTLVPFDADGDGIDEIYAWNQIIEVNEDGSTTRRATMPYYARAAAANVDSDWREELVLANHDGYAVWGLNGLDEFVQKHIHTGPRAAYDSPALALGNVDLDSPIVRYDGEHELLFTQPQIITLMSAPPFQAGVGQDVDSTSTTYGEVLSSEVVEEKSMGMNVGFSVGYEYENDLFGTGFSAKASFEAAFDVHASESKTREDWFSHSTAPGEDKVVFTTVPFDVYYYTIISSPNPDDVGRTVTVNLPRNQQTLGASLEFYNANNGGGLDIDYEVLGHISGEVWSYPTAEDKEKIMANAELENPGYLRLWNGPIQVDESGSNSLGLSTSEGSSRGASVDLSTQFEFEAKAGGATVGTSVGFHYGWGYEVSTEKGAFYEGTVGSLPGDVYADWAYCYGLMVYPERISDQHFVKIDWWTQQRCGE